MSIVTKTASSPQSFRSPAFFYHSAREGMAQVLEHVPGGAKGVLLPGYIGWSPLEGSGVFDPVRAARVEPGFYGLDESLSPDLDAVEELAQTGRFTVLVVIHYFGRVVTTMPELRAIADRYGLLLVEDLAHGFFTSLTGRAAGLHGDVCLYSLHKMFPMATGGMVTYANDEFAGGATSTYSAAAGEILNYDWARIAEQRRSNFDGLVERLTHVEGCGTDFTLLWPSLQAGEVPQSLPLFIHGDNRDAIYHSMNAAGFGVVSLYHTLIEEVRGTFPRLDTLASHITNLPCHQDVPDDSLDRIVEAFERSLRAS